MNDNNVIQLNKSLNDLINIIQFTERVSIKIHGLLNKEEIYEIICSEFEKSKRYVVHIVMLTKDGSKMKFIKTSLAPKLVRMGEKIAKIRIEEYKIDINKTSFYKRVLIKGETLQIKASTMLSDLLPKPMAYMITKAIGYGKKMSIISPLRQFEHIIGAIVMDSTDLAEYFLPSVKMLTHHISTALELADEEVTRKKIEKEKEKLIEELKEALAKVKTLSGFIPICSHCKKIRDDKGYWTQVEEYVRDHTEAEFSHSLCPDCIKKYYHEYYNKTVSNEKNKRVN